MSKKLNYLPSIDSFICINALLLGSDSTGSSCQVVAGRPFVQLDMWLMLPSHAPIAAQIASLELEIVCASRCFTEFNMVIKIAKYWSTLLLILIVLAAFCSYLVALQLRLMSMATGTKIIKLIGSIIYVCFY